MLTSEVRQATVPTASAAARRSWLRTAATWLFLLPLLCSGVLPGVVKTEVAGLAVLALISSVILREPVPFHAARRAYLTFAVLSLTTIGYVVFGKWPVGVGTSGTYDAHAATFVMVYTAVGVFAALFFDIGTFERVMWRGSTVALWIGVITCAASQVTGHPLLVNLDPAATGLRMMGTLHEPSAWAGPLAVVLLLALRRRSCLYVCLSLVGLLLTDSPDSLLVVVVTIPPYFILAHKWRARLATTVVLIILVPLAALFVRDANTVAMTSSSNSAKVAIGRLVSGIRNVESGGNEGTNDRYASVHQVTSAAANGGWTLTGAGPAADTVYFPTAYPVWLGRQAANAMWLSVLFDFGEWGTAVLAVMMLVAIWRMRRSPLITALLLPFFVSSILNDSVPDYSLTVLGIVLFTFGWPKDLAEAP